MNTVPPHDSQGNPLTAYIYALVEPDTQAIRYVGKTTTSLRERLNNHLCEKKDDRKTRWIKSLKRRGLKPTIQLIEEVPIDTWEEREVYWMAYYRAQGIDLTNTALGGQGGRGHSQETKDKLAAANLGIDRGPEFRAKMQAIADTRKGIKRPPEVGEKVRASKLGKKRKPFTRSDKGKRRKPMSPETRVNVSVAMKRSHAMRKRPPSGSPTLWD